MIARTAELITAPPADLCGYDPRRDADEAGCWFDLEAANKYVAFFPRVLELVTGKVAGRPFELMDYARDYVATLYGWKRQDGTRRYRESLLAIPRKNAKTTLAAGLALDSLVCDGEQGAQVYCAAGSRDQATLVFEPAAKMVRRSKQLSKRMRVIDSTKRIIFQQTGSVMRAIPAEAATSHGFDTHVAIMDELHTQPDRQLYDVLKTSMGARTQPLMVSITTAGHDKESICYEVWEYARNVRDGVVCDPYFLPVIYEATDQDDWTDPDVWRRVNPGLGTAVSEQYLREAFERAKAVPAFETTFKNLHLNMWTDSAETWLSSEAWRACGGELPDLTGRHCYAAIDLGSTDDLTALVYVFPFDDGTLAVKCHAWVPDETVREARKAFQAQYRTWVDRGWMKLSPGKSGSYEQVIAQLAADRERFHIQSVAYDRWNADHLASRLRDEFGFEMVSVPQSCAGLNLGTRTVEEAVSEGKLLHDGNPVLTWCVASSSPVQDSSGNRKPNKRTSSGKIDAAVAMVMACQLARLHKDTTPGILFV